MDEEEWDEPRGKVHASPVRHKGRGQFLVPIVTFVARENVIQRPVETFIFAIRFRVVGRSLYVHDAQSGGYGFHNLIYIFRTIVG